MGYHKAKVHQQVTTVTFKCQPAVHITITRNSETKSFHCPHCDRQYPLPVNLRVSSAFCARCLSGGCELRTQDHMVLKCVGYAQHRASPPLKIKIRPSKDVQPEKPANDGARLLDEVVAVKEEKEDEVIITAADAKTTQDSESEHQHLLRASALQRDLASDRNLRRKLLTTVAALPGVASRRSTCNRGVGAHGSDARTYEHYAGA